MSMTDPIADMLTRIRNGLRCRHRHVDMLPSRMRVAIARVLRDEGYITGYQASGSGRTGVLRIELKYGPDDEQIIRSIQRVSRPSRRVYSSVVELKPVLNGTGIAILSTPRGVLSDREARRAKVGGEVLARIW